MIITNLAPRSCCWSLDSGPQLLEVPLLIQSLGRADDGNDFRGLLPAGSLTPVLPLGLVRYSVVANAR